MTLIDRFLMLVYSLFVAFLSLLLILFTLGLVNINSAWAALTDLQGNYVYTFVGLIIFLVNLQVLFSGISASSRTISLVQETALGEVRISAEAVQNLALRAARQVRGVRDVKARFCNGKNGLVISLRTLLAPDVKVPEASLALQDEVKRYVEEMTGTAVAAVQVSVTNITPGGKTRVE